MAETEQLVVGVWNQWGLHALVLLSFAIQVTLLILAELRRRMDSGVLRIVVWSAYMLADFTAIYVLGHLSVNNRSPEHALMGSWAPFLLLHLGGQDNITAYAVEDNRLWLRHVQTLAVQVAAAAYVVYQQSSMLSRSRSSSLLLSATIIMFVVGVAKYGERVWALRCAGNNRRPGGNNYRSIEKAYGAWMINYKAYTNLEALDTEYLLQIAHDLLDIPKDWLVEGKVILSKGLSTDLTVGEAYKVVEMQLSLMHDVFYTKAVVIHTWYGFCIRILSSLGTALAFVLFNLLLILDDRRHGMPASGYSRVDVVVSYALFVGALLLEILSLLRALFSSWTCALLKNCRRLRGDSVSKFLSRVRRLVHAANWRRRYWSGSMGQHNLLQLCVRSRASRCSKIARWMGVEDTWNTVAFSWSPPVTPFIEQRVMEKRTTTRTRCRPGDKFFNLWARELLDTLSPSPVINLDGSVEENILIWHIASDIYLHWLKKEQRKDKETQTQEERAKAVEALSNYMVFILAARPSLLPPTASRDAYVQMCYALLPSEKMGKPPLPHCELDWSMEYGSVEDLANSLWRLGDACNTGSATVWFRLTTAVQGRLDSSMAIAGSQLGAKLIVEDQLVDSSIRGNMLEPILQTWVDMLFFVGVKCSSYSHIKQLSNGGELITIAALLQQIPFTVNSV